MRVDLYAAKTRLHSLRWLYTMDRADLDAFLNAYVLFDGDWHADNGKRESHIIDYYRVINHLCALGSVEKMYFPPLLDAAEDVKGNQVLFERKMIDDIRANTASEVLDIGCGRGRVAAHVAKRTGAHVTGLNIDASQISNGRSHARSLGLGEKTRFVEGSLNDPLPFADGSFGAAYQIQAFTYAKDKTAVFEELWRVLRPGARFAFLDWVRLPAFDPDNPEHVELMKQTCAVIGAVDTPTPQDIENAMQEAGFEVISSGDASVGGHQTSLIKSERRFYQRLRRAIRLGVKARLLPEHFPTLFERLGTGAEAFVQADELGLSTTSYYIVAAKPA